MRNRRRHTLRVPLGMSEDPDHLSTVTVEIHDDRLRIKERGERWRWISWVALLKMSATEPTLRSIVRRQAIAADVHTERSDPRQLALAVDPHDADADAVTCAENQPRSAKR